MSENATSPTAVVTGAGRGIGRATAAHLIEHGFHVILAERDVEAGRDAEQALGGAEAATWVGTDVGREPEVTALFAHVQQRHGRLDLLVNNAAVTDPATGPVDRLSLEAWDSRIRTNLTGAMLCSKHAAALLRGSGGSIVNIASTRALQSEPDTEAYAAAKAGLIGLTHAMAVSLGPEIRVNAVSPGWIDTTGWRAAGDREGEALTETDHAQHPAGRVGRPEDVAEAVLYLARAGFVTGTNLVVDGGMTRKMIYAE